MTGHIDILRTAQVLIAQNRLLPPFAVLVKFNGVEVDKSGHETTRRFDCDLFFHCFVCLFFAAGGRFGRPASRIVPATKSLRLGLFGILGAVHTRQSWTYRSTLAQPGKLSYLLSSRSKFVRSFSFTLFLVVPDAVTA